MRRTVPIVAAGLYGILALALTPAGVPFEHLWAEAIPTLRYLVGAPGLIFALVTALLLSWGRDRVNAWAILSESFLAVALVQVVGALMTGIPPEAMGLILGLTLGYAALGLAISRLVRLLPAAMRLAAVAFILVLILVVFPAMWPLDPIAVTMKTVQDGAIPMAPWSGGGAH